MSENFPLRRLEIRGDHNKLTAIPPFVGLKEIDLNASGLASISDYSWGYDATEGFKCNEYAVIDLAAAHHRQGKPAATLKLVEMAERILTEGKTHSQEFGMRCIEGLIGFVLLSSYRPAELLLGRLFLEGKLIDVRPAHQNFPLIRSNYEKAQQFFKLALDREANIEKKEELKQKIEWLEHQYFHAYYQKAQLLFYLEEDPNLLPELSQSIYSMGYDVMKGPR